MLAALTGLLDFSHYEFNPFAIPPLLIGSLLIFSSVLAFIWEKASRISALFSLMLLSAAIWLLGSGMLYLTQNPETARLWIQVYHLGVILIPVFILLFVIVMTHRVTLFWPAASFCFLISAVFSYFVLAKPDLWLLDFYRYAWGYYPRYHFRSVAFLGFFFVILVLSFRLLQSRIQNTAGRAHQRLKAFSDAFALAILASFDFAPAYGIAFYPFGYVWVLGFIILSAHAIWLYRLKEITTGFAAPEILGTMRSAALVADLDGHIRLANPSACHLLGYSQQELLKLNITDIMKNIMSITQNESREISIRNRLVLSDNGKIYDYPMNWRRRDGSEVVVSVSASILKDDDLQVQGLVYTALDITQRKKAEEALRESEELFRLLVDAVQNYAILMLDPQGCVMTWNTGAKKINGYEAQEIIGKHFSCFHPPEDLKHRNPSKILEKALTQGRFEEEGWRIRKDGSRFWAHVTLTSLRDSKGNLRGFTKITWDMTEIKKTEEVLRQREALEIKSRFVTTVSHEIRTPLTAIKMGLDILSSGEAGVTTPPQKEWIEMAQKNVGRLAHLVDEILEFQKLESGRMNYQIQPNNLNELIRELEKSTLRHLTTSQKLEFEFIPDPNLPLISFDREKIAEIVINLVSNAVKFSSQGQVKIRTALKDTFVEVSVEDNGIGIRLEDRPKLFHYFSQIPGKSKHLGGTGLGLAICKKIIEHHGGSIDVHSEYGKGSVFFFRLPLITTEVSTPLKP